MTLDELVGTRVEVADQRGARRGHPQGRRADGRRCSTAPCTPGSSSRPSRWSSRAGHASGGCRRTSCARSSPSCAPATSGTAPRGRCSPSGSRTRCSPRWRPPASRRTTGCRTRSPAACRCAGAVDALWPAVDPVRVVLSLLSDADVLAAAADGVLDDDEQAALLWAKPARGPKTAPWSTGRRGAGRRGRATSSSGRRASATSCSTRRRTSPRCSCGSSGAGARRPPRPCSVTSRRAPPRGRPPGGTRR